MDEQLASGGGHRTMTNEDKLKWLIREGFIERTTDGTYRLTEEGEYITGRLNQEKDIKDGD
jgi:predicted transcriptional regulator